MMNKQLMKSKKGGMLLRDVMFSVVIFASIIAFASIFVTDMANTYSNTNLTNEYAEFNNNVTLFTNEVDNSTNSFKTEAFSEKSGAWGFLAAIFAGVGSFLQLFISVPNFIGNFLASSLVALGVPSGLYNIITFLITSILFILIAFGIGTAISRGSKM